MGDAESKVTPSAGVVTGVGGRASMLSGQETRDDVAESKEPGLEDFQCHRGSSLLSESVILGY